jgi:hypothetical protein
MAKLLPGRCSNQIKNRVESASRRVARSVQKGVGLPVEEKRLTDALPEVTKEKASRSASGFYGVRASGKRWEANIYKHKTHYLGSFVTKQEAALAYDREARQCRGEKRLNYDSIEAAEEAAAKAQAEHSLGAEASDPDGVNCESSKAAEEVAVQAQAKQQDILV